MLPGVNPLYSITKYIYSTLFLSLSHIMLGGSPFSICLWCCACSKMLLLLQCPMYLISPAFRVPAVACVADVADNPAFAGFPTGDEFPTVSVVPIAAVISAITLYLYPIADVPAVVFLFLGCCWLSFF
jgi:hypothetical protein